MTKQLESNAAVLSNRAGMAEMLQLPAQDFLAHRIVLGHEDPVAGCRRSLAAAEPGDLHVGGRATDGRLHGSQLSGFARGCR
ncbi:MAG: hypothetical protein ACOY33_08320 [Pseudomonadota bacterium]